MSTVSRTDRWAERVGDWMNAILVKETRQALKSRQFVITFMLLLLASWFVAVFWMLGNSTALEYRPVGRMIFSWFYFVLAFATVIIIPFSTYVSLLRERDLNTFELLSITSLSPNQIVWGKLLSALVQLFIFYSAITPFIAFNSLLLGFDAPSAAFLLVATMLISLFLSMFSLMLSSLAKKRFSQYFLMFVVLGMLVNSFGQVFAGAMFLSDAVLSTPETWWVVGFVFIAGASYFALFQKITTAQLTFESDNHSTGIRIVCTVQFWLLWGCYLGYHAVRNTLPDEDLLLVMIVLSSLHWTVAGLFFATEADSLSRRIRRDLHKNRLWRALAVGFLPGGARGYLLTLGHLAALWVVALGTTAMLHSVARGEPISRSLAYQLEFQNVSENRLLVFATVLIFYVTMFLGLATALARWGRVISTDLQANHIRVVTFLSFMAATLFPFLPRSLRIIETQQFTYIDLVSPIHTLESLDRAGGTVGIDQILFILLTAATVSVLVSLRAMYSGITDVLQAEVKPRPVEGTERTSP